MLYFSECYKKPVYDRNNVKIGMLTDFIFLPIVSPVITKAVIQISKSHLMMIPIKKFHKVGKNFVVDEVNTMPYKLEDNEASVRKHIQDQQIIDITGSKVIRANDVIIQDSPGYIITGIDIGVIGILRWIKPLTIIADLLRRYNIQYKSDFLAWKDIQPIERNGNTLVLREEKAKLERLQPEDLADYLEQISTLNALKILRLMNAEQAAEVIADINTGFQAELFKQFSCKKAAELITLVDADEAVDILLTLTESKRKKILDLIPEEKQKPILHLLKHATTPVGHLLSTDYIAVNSDLSIRAIQTLLKSSIQELPEIPYIYIMNKSDQLTGILSLQTLLKMPLDIPVYKVMEQNLIVIRLTTPREIALQKMLKYHIYAVPVVDDTKKMLGIVSIDSVMEEMTFQD